MTTYINCPSYDPLFYLIYRRKKGDDVAGLTINKSVKKYCDHEGIPCHLFYSPFASKNLPRNYKRFKKGANKLIAKTDSKDSFILFGNSYSIEGFYFAKELSKRCDVFYQMIGEGYPLNKRNIPLKYFIVKKLLKYYLDLDIIYFSRGKDGLVMGISDNFIKKYGFMEFNKVDIEKIKEELILKYPAKANECDYLLLEGFGTCKNGMINADMLRRTYEIVMKNTTGLKIKEHPNFKFEDGFFGDIEKYPDFIPAEFLLGNIKRGVISVLSTSALTASKDKNLKIILLMDIVKYNDLKHKRSYKKKILENSDRVFIPRNLEELKSLLK